MWPFDGFRSKPVVTLVIEASDVRFLSARGNQVSRWGSVPVPDGIVRSGIVEDVVTLGRLIDELFRREGLGRDRVITAVSGLRAIPRILTLPRLRSTMLEQAISREARKEMPVSTENLYLSWQTLPSEGQQQRVYLLGIPRELIDSQLDALEVAGIKPYASDLKPLALVRALAREEAIIVNLEREVLDLVLVHDGLPTIMRSFDTNGSEAELAGRVEHLVTELNQTVRFYNDGHQQAPILPDTPICATGSVFAESEAMDYLRAISERPLARLDCAIECPPDLPRLAYAVNMGLALKKVG